jgi:hypothetical protein
VVGWPARKLEETLKETEKGDAKTAFDAALQGDQERL